jgi:hypothetical protein
VELGKHLVQSNPEAADHWNMLGVAHYRNSDWKAAIDALTQSERRGSERLGPSSPAKDHFFLAMAHWQLGDKEKARHWYDKGVRWVQRNHPKDEELDRFDAEATALLGVKDRATRVLARPKPGNVQPDFIDFGTVYTGAIVEGSFMIFVPGKDTDRPFAVAAPPFVKVRGKSTQLRDHSLGKVVGATVEFVLDTSAAGDLSGEVSVTFGTALTRVPVRATVRPAKKGLTRLLIVGSPFDRYSTDDGERFQPWTDLVKGSSLNVDYLLPTAGNPALRDLDLGKYDCVLLSQIELQPADIKRLRAFAEAGGRVVVAACIHNCTLDDANALLHGYGLEMRKESADQLPLAHAMLQQKDLDPELVKAGVTAAYFFNASPVAVTDARSGRVLAAAVGVGKPGDGFVALAKAGKGEVIALGDQLWWYRIGDRRAEGTDTARLLLWLLDPRKGR